MWRRLLAVAGLLVTVAGAGGATAASNNPVFRVTVRATYEHVISYSVVDVSGCASGEARRRMSLQTVKPFVRPLSKLLAKNGAFQLAAQETRTVTEGPRHTCGPEERGGSAVDTSGCGRASYKVGSGGTAAGYLSRRSDRFEFFFTRIGPDPYGGRCFNRGEWVVEGAPGSTGGVAIFNYPPGRVWGPQGRPSGVELDRSVLRSAKRYVVRWSDSASGPTDYFMRESRYAVSWTVTLVRIR